MNPNTNNTNTNLNIANNQNNLNTTLRPVPINPHTSLTSPPKNQPHLSTNATIAKSSIFLSFLFLVSLNTNIGFLNDPIPTFQCVYDLLLKIFVPVNRYFQSDARDYLLIFSSMLIDFSLLTTAAVWVFQGKTWAFPTYMAIFYAFRAVIQQIYQFPFPPDYNFYYPGFPSIAVPYSRMNDFFFSGHIGLPILCGRELKNHGYYLMFYITIFSSCFEAFTMLALSGHYTVDLIMGGVIALSLTMVVSEFVDTVSWLKMKDTTCESERNGKVEYYGQRVKDL